MDLTTGFAAFPPLLDALTIHLRVGIGHGGWNATLAQWGESGVPGGSFLVQTRASGDGSFDLAQNYAAFPDYQGRCDVLEIEVGLRNHHPVWTTMRVGVPAARVGKGRVLDVVCRFDGRSLALYVDGVKVDEDWTLGRIPRGSELRPGSGFDGEIFGLELFPRALTVSEIEARSGGAAAVCARAAEMFGAPGRGAQYWTPPGHNQWVGDVVLADTRAFDPGCLHLYYLIDRRHGASKFGAGGHFFAHMSSRDLIHWEHHLEVIGLEPWNSLGTGRHVVHDGKIVMAYGMHTSRLLAADRVFSLERTPPLSFSPEEGLPEGGPGAGRFPMGATLAESRDGVTFEQSHLLVHAAQNPAVVREHDGPGFLLFAGYGAHGLYRSDDLRHWGPCDPNVIPTNEASPVSNTDECQCQFEWNGWHYLIAGRTGFWMSRRQTGPYWGKPGQAHADVVRPRWNIHDGLWVPMVAPFGDNRRLLAGFLTGPGAEWAGHLVFRELIQLGDGTLGLTWPPEMRPAERRRITPDLPCNPLVLDPARPVTIRTGARNLFMSLTIQPGSGTTHVAVMGLGETGEGCALSCHVAHGRAQWNTTRGDGLPGDIPSLEEIRATDPEPLWSSANPNLPFKGGDFTITGVEGFSDEFTVEILFLYDPKSLGTIVDACIAGHRTMITRRPGLMLDRLRLLADGPATIHSVVLSEIDRS